VILRYEPGLNQHTPFAERVEAAFLGSRRAHLAAAYAKSSGVAKLLQLGPPHGSRAVVGLGFGISDPLAVEQLDQRVARPAIQRILAQFDKLGEDWRNGDGSGGDHALF
jgi:hypothetical protein